MNGYNLIWLFIDGVRRYPSSPKAIEEDDDRGRLRVMDDFASESVEFLNVVTSAPSTFMAVSAMLSGIHSYYISRNYRDFIFDENVFIFLRKLLISNGYSNFNFWMSRESRETMSTILPVVNRKYWPKSFSHAIWWSNEKICELVNCVLDHHIEFPAFFFVDFNCRKDSLTSDKVDWVLRRFRTAGYREDNTIVILCSDHGYPDHSKDEGRPEYFQARNLSHDIVLTDDNIMIPLFIQYPGCIGGQKVETTVANIDIFPTIVDILGLELPNEIQGHSLLPLMNGDRVYEKMMEMRLHRCDSRLAFQTGRGTAIRNGKFKYIYYHDQCIESNQELFFDIEKDKLEKVSLAKSDDLKIQNELNIFRKSFEESEKAAIAFQLKYLFKKFCRMHRQDLRNAGSIVITDSCSPLFIEMIIKMVRRLNQKTQIYVLAVEHDYRYENDDVQVIKLGYREWCYVNIDKLPKMIGERKIDVLFVPYSTSEERDNVNLRKCVRKIAARKKVYLDYNMESYRGTAFRYHLKKFKTTWDFLKYEPSYVLVYVRDRTLRLISVLKRPKWK